MLGMVFRELLELIEDKFGADAVDDVLDAADVASGGAYTSVGTYPHGEMVQLVVALAEHTRLPARDLLHAFAEHLMQFFASRHPEIFEHASSTLDFIESVDRHIHREVRKLYPDAELPTFHSRRVGPDTLEIDYVSSRGFEELAHGLMLAAARHFGETVTVEQGERTEDGRIPFRVLAKAA